MLSFASGSGLGVAMTHADSVQQPQWSAAELQAWGWLEGSGLEANSTCMNAVVGALARGSAWRPPRLGGELNHIQQNSFLIPLRHGRALAGALVWLGFQESHY